MTATAKPRMDVDVIEALDFTLECADKRCDNPAAEMLLHAACDEAEPACAPHAYALRRLLEVGPRIHNACNQRASKDNTTFRTI